MSLPLADAIFWIAVACCTLAQLAIIHSVFVSPARAEGSEPTTRVRRAGELAWAVLPGIGLALLLVYTWAAMHAPRIGMVPGGVS